ncbi:MAG TPA: TetR/AcrR family transcriptional regulator [Actinomycetota bacterium]
MTEGPDTRERIMEAARDTLGEDGIAGATARAIARRGGFNQALIFYHFGSIPQLLMEAFRHTSQQQVERYREAAAGVSSLGDLVTIARRLHDEDLESGAVTAVTQLMAAASDPELGGQILEGFEQWIALVEEAMERSIPQGAGGLVPTRPAAYAICAMFLGIELMSRLDPERSEAHQLFDMMANMAALIEQMAPLLFPAR